MIRRIIEINEALCNGCSACVTACHEGAIQMIDGKAKLMRDDYCDGLGDCLPSCPTNAITFTKREAKEFDLEAVKKHQESLGVQHNQCPGSLSHSIKSQEVKSVDVTFTSQLRQWPVQIQLAPINAPYFDNEDIV
ncbi:MAG: ATP-binding protein, partial [Coprobacillaceae bacterium]